MGKIKDFLSSFKNINKAKEDLEVQEGASDLLEELKLEMPDDELISLKNDWIKQWEKYYSSNIKKKQEENEKYWLGQQFGGNKIEETDRAIVDNVLFEAIETFLPIATKRNPEPTVRGDNTKEGEELAKRVQSMLVYQADIQRIKLKLKKVCRFWSLYLLGFVKISWSVNENDISTKAKRPQKLILDPDGTINEDMQYDGEYLGEYMGETASKLIKRFPKKANFIKREVRGKMGTKVKYIEWWTEEYVFWTLRDEVLGKAKNPHWNYPDEEVITDEFGEQTTKMAPGKNHFNYPKIPYVFLSVFNIGKHPFDDTSLIGQNLSNQDIINKRQAQIDRNIDGINGGWIVSGELSGLTQEQATTAIETCKRGGGLWIAQGSPSTAVQSIQASGLPADVFNHLVDSREELRNVFGVRGSSPQGTMKEQTLGGKMIIKEQDSSRIGGGISEYLEQFCDQVFNWWVQMMYVYYDEEHLASIVGKDRAVEFVKLSSADFNTKICVSIKEGSLLPKDELSEANNAIMLAQSNLIDPISLFDKLGYSNPQEQAERLYVWLNSPELLFPETAKAVLMTQQAKMAEEAATQMTINEQAQAGQMAITEPSPEEKKAKGDLEHKRALELKSKKK